MIRIGSLIETTNAALRVTVAPDYIRLGRGEVLARSLRTGEQYIAKVNPVGFPGRPSLARIALFTVTTETDSIDGGRPFIYGRKGRFVTGTARTLAVNVG